MKVLLVNDTTGWYHFGCTGTSLALKKELENLGCELSSFSILDCNALDYLPGSVEEFFDKEILAKFIAHNHALCALIQNNDVIVVNGEGTLHGAKRGPLSLLYIVYIAKSVFAKNVQIINHSVYPNDSVSAEDNEILSLYKNIYKTVDFVAIREPISVSIMRSIGLDVHESFDCLPLYIKHYYQPNLCNKQNDLILLAGSAAWFNLNIFTPDAQAGDSLKNGLMQVIKALQPKMAEGYRVRFLYSDLEHPAKDDQEMLSFLKGNIGPSFSVIHARSIDSWLRAIEEADLLISGRFHHSIAAACLGTKFIALNSNTPKMTGLMKSMGHPKPLIYSDLKLENKLKRVIPRSAICTNSPHMLDNLCKKAQNNFTMLRKLSLY